ncbi:predicted protein [Nematostella vectensis]|uniref:Uncharacterized protein n=1 Tax=Nematostella vectensis TaxID=45351 RepID=A7S351_NEMVE|nr:predicted protein [Nematostella vectensis]|eukprot:XP_001633995.1 predicted protein [Nematostella vectensis]
MALVKRDDNLAVAVPESAKNVSKKNVKVLDEDTYVQSVDKIIQRDFFPELSKLRAQHEYLDAVEHNDTERLREISSRYQSNQTPHLATPATFDTPSTIQGTPLRQGEVSSMNREQPNQSQEGDKRTKDPSNLPLDKFLAKHTSEDNASFEQIMETAREKHREKYEWLYKKEEEHSEIQQASLALPSGKEGEQLMIEQRPAMVETWTYKNKNALMYVPEGTEHSVIEQIEKKAKGTQEVMHENTRFSRNPFPDASCSGMLADASAAKLAQQQGKIGVDGQVIAPSETPKVNGFGFIATPSPAPGVDASPLMTWGSIDGTPFRLDGSDTPKPSTPGPGFRMPEPKPREKLGHALAERVSRQHRDKKRDARARAAAMIGSSQGQPSSVKRLNSMSPAAQLLASKRLGIRMGTDKALQASYTPSPSHRGEATPKSTPGHSTPRTPKTPGMSTPTRTSSLTDNLLMLPKQL